MTSSRPELLGMLNLDTHILIKALDGSLTPCERNVLAADPEWAISAIVLWEVAKLYELGRIAYGLEHEGFAAALDQVHVLPITRAVCLRLSALDFHADPADEIIAATSLRHDLPLVTRDLRIRKSKIVKLVWPTG
jgi:PIN domain nuclease of toxin-antitoxin system